MHSPLHRHDKIVYRMNGENLIRISYLDQKTILTGARLTGKIIDINCVFSLVTQKSTKIKQIYRHLCKRYNTVFKQIIKNSKNVCNKVLSRE